MMKPIRKNKNAAVKKKQMQQKTLIFSGLLIAVMAIVVIIALSSIPPASSGDLLGEEVVISSSNHVPSDSVPGPYNSNPPAGGVHFDEDYSAKFFQESDLATLAPHPEGYLVHSLEHGYVIFWYNCQVVNNDCSGLKQTIQNVMNETGNTKLIAFPWSSMDIPLAMTSWGRILKFSQPDPELMKQFVVRNRYQAPEPDAP